MSDLTFKQETYEEKLAMIRKVFPNLQTFSGNYQDPDVKGGVSKRRVTLFWHNNGWRTVDQMWPECIKERARRIRTGEQPIK